MGFPARTARRLVVPQLPLTTIKDAPGFERSGADAAAVTGPLPRSIFSETFRSSHGVRARIVRRAATASASSPNISTVSSQPMQASVMLWP